MNGVLTIHRPENVDNKKRLIEIISELKKWTKYHKILFPIHPRTKKKLIKFKLINDLNAISNLKVCRPLKYNDFLLQVYKSISLLPIPAEYKRRPVISEFRVLQLEKILKDPLLSLKVQISL